MTAQLAIEPTLLTHYSHLHPHMVFLTHLTILKSGSVVQHPQYSSILQGFVLLQVVILLLIYFGKQKATSTSLGSS